MFGTTPGLYSLDVIATPTPGMKTKNISGVAKCSLGVVLPPDCLVAQSRLILCDPMDCSPPDSSVHGILQAGILEWVAMPPPGDLPDAGIEPASLVFPALAGRSFATSATWWEEGGIWNFCAINIYSVL